MKTYTKILFRSAVLVLALMLCLPVSAAEAPCETAVASGLYRHPVTGTIEDSGGESSEALGQSMVNSVVDSAAMVESAADGSLWLSLRFSLMSNISQVHLSVQQPGQSQWTEVPFDRTAQGKDTADLRLPIPGKDVILRAQCFVDAMGRDVIFYVTLHQFTPGNANGFVAMDADTVPQPTLPQGQTPDTPPVSIVDQISVSPTTADGQVVGLVVGGTDSVRDSADAQPAEGRELIIRWQVWVMFFVLVFCAQLLACLTFAGLKKLVSGHRTAAPGQAPAFDGEEDFGDWSDDDV